MTLLLCAHCARHIKSSEATCPFCGESAADAQTSGQTSPGPVSRHRAALLFGAAAISGTIALGCSSSSTTLAPPYGHGPVDSGAAEDAGNTSPDAGPDATEESTDAGTTGD